MNVKECVEKSIYITTEYYKNNNSEPYFEHMAENVLWYGTAINHKITGRETLREAFADFPDTITFLLGDIEAHYIQTSPMSCEVMVAYTLTMYYPNGDIVPLFQRTQFSWADMNITDEQKHRKRITKFFMIHISNPSEYHSADYLYPEHYNELYKSYKQKETLIQEPRISFRSTDNAFYVITVNFIIWIESTREHHCIIHLHDKTLKAKITLSKIEKQTEGFLIRVHSSYIINPLNVVSVWRFKVSLSDGTVLPIPEKKYTAIKKKLLDYHAVL